MNIPSDWVETGIIYTKPDMRTVFVCLRCDLRLSDVEKFFSHSDTHWQEDPEEEEKKRKAAEVIIINDSDTEEANEVDEGPNETGQATAKKSKLSIELERVNSRMRDSLIKSSRKNNHGVPPAMILNLDDLMMEDSDMAIEPEEIIIAEAEGEEKEEISSETEEDTHPMILTPPQSGAPPMVEYRKLLMDHVCSVACSTTSCPALKYIRGNERYTSIPTPEGSPVEVNKEFQPIASAKSPIASPRGQLAPPKALTASESNPTVSPKSPMTTNESTEAPKSNASNENPIPKILLRRVSLEKYESVERNRETIEEQLSKEKTSSRPESTDSFELLAKSRRGSGFISLKKKWRSSEALSRYDDRDLIGSNDEAKESSETAKTEHVKPPKKTRRMTISMNQMSEILIEPVANDTNDERAANVYSNGSASDSLQRANYTYDNVRRPHRPFSCKFCVACTGTLENFNIHFKRYHSPMITDSSMTECETCGKRVRRCNKNSHMCHYGPGQRAGQNATVTPDRHAEELEMVEVEPKPQMNWLQNSQIDATESAEERDRNPEVKTAEKPAFKEEPPSVRDDETASETSSILWQRRRNSVNPQQLNASQESSLNSIEQSANVQTWPGAKNNNLPEKNTTSLIEKQNLGLLGVLPDDTIIPGISSPPNRTPPVQGNDFGNNISCTGYRSHTITPRGHTMPAPNYYSHRRPAYAPYGGRYSANRSVYTYDASIQQATNTAVNTGFPREYYINTVNTTQPAHQANYASTSRNAFYQNQLQQQQQQNNYYYYSNQNQPIRNQVPYTSAAYQQSTPYLQSNQYRNPYANPDVMSSRHNSQSTAAFMPTYRNFY